MSWFEKIKIRALERDIFVLTNKVNQLRTAAEAYGNSYYTDQFIKESEKLAGFEFDLKQLKESA